MSLLLSLLLLSLHLQDILAVPAPAITPSSANGLSIELLRHRQSRSTEEWATWAKHHRDAIIIKYGSGSKAVKDKRSNGFNLLTNQNADSSFYGQVAIGSPLVSYNVILDTGSADLWVADSDCGSSCSGIPTFNTASSSTYSNLSTSFEVTYGTGSAGGTLGTDTVQMGGFSVEKQIFASCYQVSQNMLTNPVSGIMGLGFTGIAASGATPFWETLASGSSWDEPLMAFQLTRFINDSSANVLEPGGTFTMGNTNSSLYTGSIDYQNIPSGATNSYWILEMSALTVQGNNITLPSGSGSYAAIDTGTTLVGGPSDMIANVFSQISGSSPATGQYEGYYQYPCDTSVSVSLAFGGSTWTVNPTDFKLTQISDNVCIGAFFIMESSNDAPAWIVGDTFLKNVYSVFRYNPASVGFAQLSETALAMNGVQADPPSATIGSIFATATASNNHSNGARPFSAPSRGLTTTILTLLTALVSTWS